MALEIFDDRFGDHKKILSELIIYILAKEYPLRIGEIHRRLSADFGVKVSFQAVRKTLGIMTQRRILEVKDKSYNISKNYVLEMKRLSDQLLKNYLVGSKGKSVPAYDRDAAHTVYTFDSFIKLDQFCNEIILDWAYNLKENDDHTFCFQSPHYWYVFAQSGIESRFLSEITALHVDAYYISEGNTMLDRWTKKFYDMHKIRYHIIPSMSKNTVGVFGDFIVQYEYPKKMHARIEQFYRNSKDLQSMDIAGMAKLMRFDTNIQLTVIKNRIIAQKLKDEARDKFK